MCDMWKPYRKMALAGGLAAVAAAVAATAGLAAPAPAPPEARQHSLLAGVPRVALSVACLRSGTAYLRAHIRGAVRLDIDLKGHGLSCEGGPRLDGGGIRMGFEGRVEPGGRKLRMVFGIGGVQEGRAGRELPANLTVIFEGEHLLFSTQGDRNCTVDRLTQEPLSASHAPIRSPSAAATIRARSIAAKTRAYRVVAHGFCIAPANDVSGRRRILVTTFDFAGRADFNDP